jgi:hypothetical protein
MGELSVGRARNGIYGGAAPYDRGHRDKTTSYVVDEVVQCQQNKACQVLAQHVC